MSDDPNALDPAKLEAKRLEAFNVVPIKKRPPGPGRGHKIPMSEDGHTATGSGWGGPVKGASTTAGAVIECQPLSTACPRDEHGHLLEMPEKQERTALLNDNLFDIATDPAQPGGVRVMASIGALDRLEGKPVQRTITANADDLARLTDDELRAELERFGRSGT